MAHPYAGQAQSSQKARLKRLGGTAGKAHGSSSMYKKHSYPSGAGTQREYTITGGKAKSRPDRMASGGSVRKRRPHSTTNIIISHAGGRGGYGGAGGQPGGPVPVPVPRPVPVPVGAGPAPMGPGPAPVRPPIAGGPMPAGPPPVRPAVPMPPPGPPVRPPGMKAGGAVRKAANGGFLKDSQGKGYPGYPHSPTTESGDKVSAHKRGGGVKKLQFGGAGGLGSGASPGAAQGQGLAGLLGTVAPGRAPMPAQKGTPTVSGANQVPAQPLTVPQPKLASSFLQRPAPGTTTTFQKGGAVHSDEAQDKKLIKRMLAKEDKAEKRAAGGIVKTPVTNASGGGAGGKARLKKTGAAKSVPAKTESGSPNPGRNPAPRGMTGSSYHQWGKGVS
jgi:hypothetical protein